MKFPNFGKSQARARVAPQGSDSSDSSDVDPITGLTSKDWKSIKEIQFPEVLEVKFWKSKNLKSILLDPRNTGISKQLRDLKANYQPVTYAACSEITGHTVNRRYTLDAARESLTPGSSPTLKALAKLAGDLHSLQRDRKITDQLRGKIEKMLEEINRFSAALEAQGENIERAAKKVQDKLRQNQMRYQSDDEGSSSRARSKTT